ncbi:MAG: RNA polymerase sigma-54 factor, partial [Bacteroidaceae bacterium]|nr:RNA polymerase sigma-54 factor [Bacteroidaceae bacterium]
QIHRIIKEKIESEDKGNPFTDEQLSLFLKENGYIVARRTVAKYREQLEIPIARLRKN